MRKLFIMGASGKLMRYIVLALANSHQLILQCNKSCGELSKFLYDSIGESGVKNVFLVKHDFIAEGVESLGGKISSFTDVLDAAILGLPVFNQTEFHDLSEDVIRRVVYLDLIVPLSLLRVLDSFMKVRDSLVVVLTDLTPIMGSTVYEGLSPSLPTLASSAAIHAVIRESRNCVPENIKIVGVALDWVKVPSKRLPEGSFNNAIDLETVVEFVKKILMERPRELYGTVVKLSRRF